MADSNLEGGLEAFFYKRVRLVGGKPIKLIPYEKGLPDRLVIFPGGRMFFVELKTEAGALSPIQLVQHQRLAALGCPVAVVVGKPGVVAWIREVFVALDPKSRKSPRPRTKVS